MTAASDTSGSALTTASISAGLIHSPPDLIRSLARPVMIRLPSASMRARSPVGNQPSASVARLLIAEIALDDRGAAHPQMSLDAALLRQRAAVGVGEQQVDADRGAARQMRRARRGIVGGDTVPEGDSSVMPQLVCTVTPRRRSMRSISAGGKRRATDDDALQRRHLAAGALEMLDQAEPDGRHADGDRHALRH